MALLLKKTIEFKQGKKGMIAIFSCSGTVTYGVSELRINMQLGHGGACLYNSGRQRAEGQRGGGLGGWGESREEG